MFYASPKHLQLLRKSSILGSKWRREAASHPKHWKFGHGYPRLQLRVCPEACELHAVDESLNYLSKKMFFFFFFFFHVFPDVFDD